MKTKLIVLLLLFSAVVSAKENHISVKRWFGLSTGWVLKDVDANYNDDDGIKRQQLVSNTLQVGFSFAPTFGKLGLGMYSGLYYEFTLNNKFITYMEDGTKTTMYADQNPEMNSNGPMQSLYLPIHFQYNYRINPNMSLYSSVGPSFELPIINQKNRFYPNIFLGARLGFQVYGVQISVLTEWGLASRKLVNSHFHRPLSIQLSYMF